MVIQSYCVKTQLLITTITLAVRLTSFGSKPQVMLPAKSLHCWATFSET